MSRSLVLSAFLCIHCLFGEEVNMGNISETFGHIIYRNFSLLDVAFDVKKIVQGIEAAAAGKNAPLTEKDCINAIHEEQDRKFKLLCQKNLEEAENFMASNGKQQGVVSLEGGKVQYCIIHPGNGAKIGPHSSPFIRSTVQPDGLDIWPPNHEETISLNETIPGLKAGLLGMKENERRVVYIHPDLAYGTKGLSVLQPNALLRFDIEVLKADVCSRSE